MLTPANDSISKVSLGIIFRFFEEQGINILFSKPSIATSTNAVCLYEALLIPSSQRVVVHMQEPARLSYGEH
jgi:hypothetical protein